MVCGIASFNIRVSSTVVVGLSQESGLAHFVPLGRARCSRREYVKCSSPQDLVTLYLPRLFSSYHVGSFKPTSSAQCECNVVVRGIYDAWRTVNYTSRFAVVFTMVIGLSYESVLIVLVHAGGAQCSCPGYAWCLLSRE